VIRASSFDSAGFLVAFVFAVALIPTMVVLYWRERQGRQRAYYLFRYRWGVAGAVFLAVLTGVRRFVIHQ
jgi:hypothetical protein